MGTHCFHVTEWCCVIDQTEQLISVGLSTGKVKVSLACQCVRELEQLDHNWCWSDIFFSSFYFSWSFISTEQASSSFCTEMKSAVWKLLVLWKKSLLFFVGHFPGASQRLKGYFFLWNEGEFRCGCEGWGLANGWPSSLNWHPPVSRHPAGKCWSCTHLALK